MSTQADRARTLLDAHGQSFADEAGINVARGTPVVLWQLLVESLLLSSRISARLAVRATRQVKRELPTAQRIVDASAEQVHAVLERGDYLRTYRTADLLQASARHCLDTYGGDLRRLRQAAEGDPARAAELLQEFPGIGEVGAEVFLREVQVAWTELAPYAGSRALARAEALGLPADAVRLAALVDDADVVRLMAALVRSGLEQAGEH